MGRLSLSTEKDINAIIVSADSLVSKQKELLESMIKSTIEAWKQVSSSNVIQAFKGEEIDLQNLQAVIKSELMDDHIYTVLVKMANTRRSIVK